MLAGGRHTNDSGMRSARSRWLTCKAFHHTQRATLTYYFKDGRVVRERTGYGLVNEGGRLKISSSMVLSSVTL